MYLLPIHISFHFAMLVSSPLLFLSPFFLFSLVCQGCPPSSSQAAGSSQRVKLQLPGSPPDATPHIVLATEAARGSSLPLFLASPFPPQRARQCCLQRWHERHDTERDTTAGELRVRWRAWVCSTVYVQGTPRHTVQ